MFYEVITNPYKRNDVFRCTHPSHQKFNHQVSAYHVLKEKKCYPDGCLFFEWHCSLLEKGNRCVHGYQYAGKKCKGCTHYFDEKFHFQPECLLNDDAYQKFEEEAEQFNAWLEAVYYKCVACSGRIQSVKPWFEYYCHHHQKKRIFKGYLLVFENGFIGNHPFHGHFYVRISDKLMKQYGFVSKMKIDFVAEVRYNQGRIVLYFPKAIEILNRGWGYRWSRSKALVALKTGTTLKYQTKTCLSCTWSVLIDSVDEREQPLLRTRKLHCIKGVPDPDVCSYHLMKRFRKKLKKTKNE